jgi:hypothetical protein
VRLSVSAGDRRELTLRIGEPGPGSVIEVVDGRGKPANAWVEVERPRGPLTERLWPASFAPDGAGLVRLPPLEARKHRVKLRGGKEQWLTVPALAGPRARPARLRLVAEAAPRGEE